MTDPYFDPTAIPWKTYIQYAALRSRELLNQRQPNPIESDEDVTAIDDRPCLLLHFSDATAQYWFDTKGYWRIGRSKDCEIVLPDQCVSRYHAAIQLIVPDEFYLVDLNSYNGSFINGRRVREISRLYSGDRISLGQVELEFHGSTPTKFGAAMEERSSQSNRPVAL